ncbi:MAG TPA: 3-oxoadipate enol-lactonase [Nocardioides sp.]|nr:3-oxoadipate enol-lactonase [Nocardioides sp.]
MTDSVRLHHTVAGDPGPAVLLGPSLGTTGELWRELAADLSRDHRVVSLDLRGHGGSPVPPGPYTVEELAADVVATADALGLDRFAYVGLSIGGAVGQVLGLDHADRLTSLVLCCTAPVFGDPATWMDRAAQVRRDGLEPLVEATTERWFTPAYREAEPDRVAWVMDMFRATPVEGYAGCCEALSGYDVSERLGQLSVPTRVVAGAEDPGTPPEVGRRIADAVPDADLVVLDGAAHIANVAVPGPFNAAVREHLVRT